MRTNVKPFFLSVLFGGISGVIVGYYFAKPFENFFPLQYYSLAPFFYKYFNRYFLILSMVAPILVLVFAFILKKKFSLTWSNVRTRLLLLVSMLLVYAYGIFIGDSAFFLLYESFGSWYEIILGSLIFFLFGYPLALLVEGLSIIGPMFLYSSILAFAASYVATEGIEGIKRVVVGLMFWLLMSSVSSTLPFIYVFGFGA